MADRWTWVARLLALHGEACAALALLRCEVGGRDGGLLAEVAAREKVLARALERLSSARGAPRHLKSAGRQHAEAVARMLA